MWPFKDKKELKQTPHQQLVERLQRMDVVMERICTDRLKIARDYENACKERDHYREEAARLARKLSATKGVVTKLRNAVGEKENTDD